MLIAVVARAAENPRLRLAVAASAAPAAQEIADVWSQRAGVEVVVAQGATGMLERQLREGAPYDLFLSADTATPNRLAADDILTSESLAVFARGRLILWRRADSTRALAAVEDLAAPAWDGARLGIPNPETAPYGRAAIEALTNAGLLARYEGRIVRGENVRQAYQFAESGNVDVAFVAGSFAGEGEGLWFDVPTDLYSPIDQSLGIVTASPQRARAEALRAFILGPDGQAILARHGFASPPATR